MKIEDMRLYIIFYRFGCVYTEALFQNEKNNERKE